VLAPPGIDTFGITPGALRDVDPHGLAASRAANTSASSKSPRSKSA
jgi:hypothetical protein